MTNKPARYIFCHSDADGFMSAALMFHVLNSDGEVFGTHEINYGEYHKSDTDMIMEYAPSDEIEVYIVDFYEDKMIEDLLARDEIKLIHVFDHHSTTPERAQKFLNNSKFLLTFTAEKYEAACKLIFNTFKNKLQEFYTIHEMNKIEEMVDLVSTWDTWDRRDIDKFFNLAFPFKLAVESKSAVHMINYLHSPIEAFDELEKLGKILLEAEQAKARTNLTAMVPAAWTVVDQDGNELTLKVVAFNTPFKSSMLYEIPVKFEMIEDLRPDIIMSYHRMAPGKFSVSIYQYGNKDLHLGSIARQFGGGGHQGAAGFQCKDVIITKQGVLTILPEE